MKRPSWDAYFMDLAGAIATRSTCPRAAVGAVIVLEKRVLATGYNGAVSGVVHCADVGCLMVDSHCARTVHAEANAVAQAARCGMPVACATLYVTHRPCWTCLKLLANSGVSFIIYGKEYGEAYPEDIEIISVVSYDALEMGGYA